MGSWFLLKVNEETGKKNVAAGVRGGMALSLNLSRGLFASRASAEPPCWRPLTHPTPCSLRGSLASLLYKEASAPSRPQDSVPFCELILWGLLIKLPVISQVSLCPLEQTTSLSSGLGIRNILFQGSRITGRFKQDSGVEEVGITRLAAQSRCSVAAGSLSSGNLWPHVFCCAEVFEFFRGRQAQACCVSLPG